MTHVHVRMDSQALCAAYETWCWQWSVCAKFAHLSLDCYVCGMRAVCGHIVMKIDVVCRLIS